MTTQILQLTPSILFPFEIVSWSLQITFVLQWMVHFWTEQANLKTLTWCSVDLFRSGIGNGLSIHIGINCRNGDSV